jgi:hypothetical protein
MPGKLQWSDDRTQYVTARRQVGIPWDAIAMEMRQKWPGERISRQAICNHMRDLGLLESMSWPNVPIRLVSQASPWNQATVDVAVSMRNQGKLWREIETATGIDRQAVAHYLRRQGLISKAADKPIRTQRPVHEINPEFHDTRWAMPPGHPVSWGAITDGTCLEGIAYP